MNGLEKSEVERGRDAEGRREPQAIGHQIDLADNFKWPNKMWTVFAVRELEP